MEFIIDPIHGSSKAFRKYYRQINVVTGSQYENIETFRKVFEFMTQTYGPAQDIHLDELLNLQQLWTFQLEPKYQMHKFFIKTKEQHSFFILKFGEAKFRRWSR